MQPVERLKEELYDAVEKVEAGKVTVAFSGGVDSSLLAQVCKNVGKSVDLLTVAFSSQRDIRISSKAAEELELPLTHKKVSFQELERSLKEVLSLIEFQRIARLQNSVCFYHVFKSASEHGMSTVLSANGADELFCGYHVYSRQFTEEEKPMKKLMKKLVERTQKDKEQFDKLADLFQVNYECPFLSPELIDFCLQLPTPLNIKGKGDKTKKHVLRKLALNLGVPRSTALRPKKAFQYSSGADKAIRKLAKREGITKSEAQQAGYQGRMDAYIQHLQGDSKP